MSKFRYALGWIAALGSIGAIIAIIVMVVALDESSIMLVRLIWLPAISLWGLREIRTYRYERKTLNSNLEANRG